MSERRTCTFCNQELTHSAFFRHLHDKSGRVCPSKIPTESAESEHDYESNEFDLASPCSSMDADSTFNFGSDDEGSEPSVPTDVHKDDVEADIHAGSEESIDTCISCSSSGRGRIMGTVSLRSK